MLAFTEAQATTFVTDPGTLKRGRELAGPTNWHSLGRTATAAWGECAGSGSQPYRTGIDLTEPAFKCSCPSRVFPCKHGAGLLLLLARQPAALLTGPPPAWLAEWLEKRQAKGDEQAEKAAAKPAKTAEKAPADASAASLPAATAPLPAATAAQLKREAQRHARMQAGTEDLETWLLDLLRAGLADLEKQPASFWESQAARLVDNQLPGLAAALRELAAYPTAGPHWAPRLLGCLGELYTLVRAFLNRENLAPAARQEVWQQVGITPKKDDLLADPTALIIADTWLVLGQHTWPEERVRGRRSWLLGQNSGRPALVLEFAFGSQPFATALVPQGKYAGELVFYPGLLPLRAAPVGLVYHGSALAAPVGQSISQLLDDYATALARQPWLRQWPATLAGVLPTPLPGGGWLLHHATEPLTLPLYATDEATDLWQLLACTGGQPATVFGEWDGRAFRLLGSWPCQPAPAQTGGPAASAAELPELPIAAAAPPMTAPAAAALLAPTDLPSWPHLLRLALLGTRQSAETLPLSAALPAAAAREQQLLLAAGAVALMQKAGYVPPAPGTVPPPPAPAPPETAAYLGPLGSECLRELLADDRYTNFISDFITAMLAHQRVVPPALLVAVLSHERFRWHLPGPAATMLGERGRWLAQVNPAWQALAGDTSALSDPATWETGSLLERRFFIHRLHRTDPAQARQLLAAVLPTEPAATQAALFSELEHSVAAEDDALLAPYLSSRSKEVRQVVVPLLVRLPGNALVERLWQRATPLLAVGAAGAGAAALHVSLPKGWDKSWLADGIEQHTTVFAGGERAGWLGQLVALLPPGQWLAHLGLSAPELLTLAAATPWATVLLRAWGTAAHLHRDKALATPLLLRHFAQPDVLLRPQVARLAGVLAEEEKVELLRSQLPPDPSAELPPSVPGLLLHLFQPWPADVVAMALRYLADTLAPAVTAHRPEAAEQLYTLLYRLSRYLPGSQTDACLEALGRVASAHPLTAAAISEFSDLLRFRQRLDASWLEPTC